MSCSQLPNFSIGRLVWPLLWAFAFLALIEVALEYRAAGRGFTTHLFGQQAKATAPVGESEDQVYGPSKAFPFRSRVVDPLKEQSIIRIWLASSSHAEDIRMDARDIFPAVLERELIQRGIDCQVLNASRAGMTLNQNATVLTSLAATWKPDIVIAYQMSNDLIADFHTDRKLPEGVVKTIPQGLPRLTDDVDRFVEETTLYELLKSNATARISQARILQRDADRTSEQNYFQQLECLQEAATDAEASFYVCTFGFSHFESDLPADYELVLLKTLPDLLPSAWGQVVHRWNRGIRDRYPNRLLDVAAAIERRPELFRDPVHFSKSGHDVVGQTIANELINRYEGLKSGKVFTQ